MELVNIILIVISLLASCILGLIQSRQITANKVTKVRLSNLESFERNYYRDRGPLASMNIGTVEYQLRKAIESNEYKDIRISQLSEEIERLEILATEKSKGLANASHLNSELLKKIAQKDETIKNFQLRARYYEIDFDMFNEAVEALHKVLNHLGEYDVMSTQDQELNDYICDTIDRITPNRSDRTVETHFNEKGEIIGAEAVEPFVQEGGEIEGFNSQVVREGKSHKIPNPGEVFEMLSKEQTEAENWFKSMPISEQDEVFVTCRMLRYSPEEVLRAYNLVHKGSES